MGARPTEGFDDPRDVLHEVIDRVVVDRARRIAKAVSPHVKRDGQDARACQGLDLFRPRFGALGETVEQDGELPIRGSVGQRAKAQSVGLNHVLTRRHLILVLRKSAATSRAWSSTASKPGPCPAQISRRALGISLIFSFSSSMRAKASRSPLSKRVGHL